MSLPLQGLRQSKRARVLNTIHNPTRPIFTSPCVCRVGGGPPWPLLPLNPPPLPSRLASRRIVEPAWKRAQKPKSTVRHGPHISPKFATFTRAEALEVVSPPDMSPAHAPTDSSLLQRRFPGFRRPRAVDSTLKLLRPPVSRSLRTATHRGYPPIQGTHRLGSMPFSLSARAFAQHEDAASDSSSSSPASIGSDPNPETRIQRIRRETLEHQSSVPRRIISSKYVDDFKKMQPKGPRSLLHLNPEDSGFSDTTETHRLSKLYQRLNDLHSSDMSSGSLHYTGDDFHPEPPKRLSPVPRPKPRPKTASLFAPKPTQVSEASQKTPMNPFRILAGVAKSAVTAVSTTSKTVFKAAGEATIKLRSMFGFKPMRSTTALPRAPDQELPPYDLMRPSYRFEQAKMLLKKSEEAHEDLRKIIMGTFDPSPTNSTVTKSSTTRRLAKLSRLDPRVKKVKSSSTPGVRQSFSTPAWSVSPLPLSGAGPPPPPPKPKTPKPASRPNVTLDPSDGARPVTTSQSLDNDITDPQIPPKDPASLSKGARRRAKRKAATIAAALASQDIPVESEPTQPKAPQGQALFQEKLMRQGNPEIRSDLSTPQLDSAGKPEISSSLDEPTIQDVPEPSPMGRSAGRPPDTVPHSGGKEAPPSQPGDPPIPDGTEFGNPRPATSDPWKRKAPIGAPDNMKPEIGSHDFSVSQSKEVEPPSCTVSEPKESGDAEIYLDWLKNLPSVPSPDLIDLPPFEPRTQPFNSQTQLATVDKLPSSGSSVLAPGLESSTSTQDDAPQTSDEDPQPNPAILEHVLNLIKDLVTIAERRNTFPRFKSPEAALLVLPMLLEAVRFAFDHRLDDIVHASTFISVREQLEKLRQDVDAGGPTTPVRFLWPGLMKHAKALQALTHPKRPHPKPSRASRLSLKSKPASSLRRQQPPLRARVFPKNTILHGSISPSSIVLHPIPRTASDPPIARLAHGLDRVLFNPAPYILQDPHTKVYNFDPYLQKIPKVADFAFERVVGFIPSSKHSNLHRLARENGKSFVGSTSSLTSLLSHIYFLISRGKLIDNSGLSQAFADAPRTFTPSARMPAAVIMHYADNVYSTDSDKFEEELDTDDQKHHILMQMGTMLEHFLTRLPADFSGLLKSTEVAEPPLKEEAYQYTLTSNLVMRSQLDCIDSRLPGTGVFDIKTRAAVAIRLDLKNFEENSGYIIRNMTGAFESFEREHYDLARSGLLKYNFQARIGNMDGIFIAFHNTAQIQGFQYINLADMDKRLFGDPGVGDAVFRMCVGLLEKVNETVKKCFPSKSVKVIYDTAKACSSMSVWVEPLNWDKNTPAPATEFTVTIQHYSDGERISKPQFGDPHWTCYYTISRTKPSIQTRVRMDDARARQNLASIFGPDEPLPPSPPPSANPVTPSPTRVPRIRSRRALLAHLRALSHQGRSYTDQLAESGQPATIWRASDVPSTSNSDSVKQGTFWSMLTRKK